MTIIRIYDGHNRMIEQLNVAKHLSHASCNAVCDQACRPDQPLSFEKLFSCSLIQCILCREQRHTGNVAMCVRDLYAAIALKAKARENHLAEAV